MSDKLDRFTKRAQRTLTLAQEEAMRLNHNAIGTEHLLLGLVREENSVAAKVLRELGAQPGQVIRAVERTVGHTETPPAGKPTLSPMTKRVIELSVDEARLMGHHYIGTEHLLHGIMRLGEGVAFNVLQALEINLDRVRTQTARHILQSAAQARQEARGPLPKPLHPPPLPTLLGPLRYDLTETAQEGKLDPLIGRLEELERIIEILSRRTKNNPVLVGEPGVGKRAIVKGLAQRMAAGQVPPSLLKRRLLVLDIGNLVPSIIYSELIERRLKKVLDEGSSSTSILFIDQIHQIVGAAGTSLDMANVIKLAVNRGDLQVIGTTTPSQFHRYMDTDAAREWYLLPVEVKESSLDETLEILRGVKSRYEAHHQLLITDQALNVAAHLAARYVTDRFLPDKAIDLIDEASSHVRTQKMLNVDEARQTMLELTQVKRLKQEAVEALSFDDAIDFRYREAELEAKLEEIHKVGQSAANQASVTMEDIAEVVSKWTGVSQSQIIDEERRRLQGEL